MRKLTYALLGLSLLAFQVAYEIRPATALADDTISPTSGKTNVTLTLNTKSHEAIVVEHNQPSFDAEVLAPLRTKQASREAEAKALAAAAKAKKRTVAKKSTTTPVTRATGDVWAALRNCEAGGDYTKNTGNGYFGAYQYNQGTWANYGGYARADMAPPEIQDAKARETQARRGWSPWPGCARKLGLL